MFAKKVWQGRFIAIIFGIFLAAVIIVAVELSIRYVTPDWKLTSGNNDIVVLHEYSEIFGWKLRKNAHGTILGKTIRTNKYGYRGREIAKEKSKRKRILILGDSLSFGYGVSDDETFAYYLEMRNRNLDVVNMSVQGYGTDQELLVLLKDGLSYRPDIVILTFCLFNDFSDNESSRFIYDQIHVKPYFTVSNGALLLHDDHLRIGVFRKFVLWLNDESALFNIALNAMIPESQAFRRRIASIDQHTINRAAPPITLSILKYMKDVVVSNNSTFVVLLVPSIEMPPGNILAETLIYSKELDHTQLIDLEQYFSNIKSRENIYIQDGIHLSPQGHRIVSEAINNELSEILQTERSGREVTQ